MVEANLIATLTRPPSSDGEELLKLVSMVEFIEVRADLTGWIEPDWLRDRVQRRLIYSLRSLAEGGNFDGPNSERHRSLIRASRAYDFIEVEAHRDFDPDLLTEIPVDKRIISAHFVHPAEIESEFERLSSFEACYYRLVSRANCAADGLAPLQLLKSLARSDVVAYAGGQVGLWSRLIAPRLGAPLVFGLAGEIDPYDGEPSVERLVADYGLPALPPLEEMYGIVGNPVLHSLSPRLHNAAYRALARPALFLPFQAESFDDFWRDLAGCQALEPLGVSIKGLTVVSPHKEVALELAGASTPMVRRAGSTNIFLRNNGHWKADTTDPQGVSSAVRRRGITLKGRRAAVVGCGGAGRAVAAASVAALLGVVLQGRLQRLAGCEIFINE